jgi:hypothetical protein
MTIGDDTAHHVEEGSLARLDHSHDHGHHGPVGPVSKGALEARMLVRRIERGAAVELVPVDTSIWLRSLALPWEHQDPADRVIVSTALASGVPLLARDDAIRAAGVVPTIW